MNLGALMPGVNTLQYLVHTRSVVGLEENPFSIATGFRAQTVCRLEAPAPSRSRRARDGPAMV